MATQKSETENESRELKRLGFVRVAAIQALVCVSSLYDYAKQSSGPLRTTVGKVETAVATVVGPVYDKLKPVPDELLSFIDRKVDEATNKFDNRAPPLAKQVVSRTHSFVLAVAKKAHKFVNEARTAGPWAAINYATDESKQLAIEQTANFWVVINRYPSIHPLAEKAASMIAHCSKKYNNVLKGLKEKGFIVIRHLPFIPMEEIAKAIKQSEAEKKEDSPAPPERTSPASPENISPASPEDKSNSDSD